MTTCVRCRKANVNPREWFCDTCKVSRANNVKNFKEKMNAKIKVKKDVKQ